MVDDSDTDTLWGGNEIHNIYVNWDANNLYLGFDYTIDGNGFLAYIDFGDAAGIQSFLNSAGYQGDWQRNITFPATNGIDAFYGVWNDQAGAIYTANGSDNSTDITANCSLSKANQGGTRYHTEISCPWSQFGFTTPIYPSGGGDAIENINIIAAIMGGDNYGGCDTAPNATIASADPYGIAVSASNFKNLGIGPNAITLTQLTGNKANAFFAVTSITLVACIIIIQRRK